MLLELLTPHIHLDSVLDIHSGMLGALGIEGLLLDLDCTLKDHYENSFRPEVVAWVNEMRRAQVRMCILTNGRTSRVQPLAERLSIACVSWAAKPFPWSVKAAMVKLGLDRTRVALVGDQVFADVLAGRLAGVLTILVRPTTTREPWTTRAKRPWERIVLRKIAGHAAKR